MSKKKVVCPKCGGTYLRLLWVDVVSCEIDTAAEWVSPIKNSFQFITNVAAQCYNCDEIFEDNEEYEGFITDLLDAAVKIEKKMSLRNLERGRKSHEQRTQE